MERHGDERGSEDEPHDERQEFAAKLGELDATRRSTTSSSTLAPKAMPATNAAMNPFASIAAPRKRSDGHGEGGQSSATRRDPSASSGGRDQHGAPETEGDPEENSATQLAKRRASLECHALVHDAELAGCHRDHEDDDRRHDAVVQPALDVERPPKPPGDALIVDHLNAEGGIGRERALHPRSRRAPTGTRRRANRPAGHRGPSRGGGRCRATSSGSRASRRSSARFTLGASENNTSASVTSARTWIDAVSTSTVERSPVRVSQDVAREREHEWTRDVVTGP